MQTSIKWAIGVLLIASFAVATNQTACAAGPLVAIAGRGPRGMVVRWFPAYDAALRTATIVRIDPNGSREPAVTVERAVSYEQAVAAGAVHLPLEAMRLSDYLARIDASKASAFASFGSLDNAIALGDAYLDRSAKPGVAYRYDVRLSDGTGAVAVAKSGASSVTTRVSSIRASGGDRTNLVAVEAGRSGALVSIARSIAGGVFEHAGTLLVAKGRGVYRDATAPLGVMVGYRAHVVDFFGNSGPESSVAYASARDLHPPKPPTNLRISTHGDAITVRWDPSRDPSVGGYEVFRRSHAGTYSDIAHLPASANSFIDRSKPGAVAFYDIRTRSREGVIGTTSGGISTLVAKTTPPDAPSDLHAKALKTEIELSWSASKDPTTRVYEIYERGVDKKRFLIAQIPTARRSYLVQLPTSSSAKISYGVGAQDSYGNRALPSRWIAIALHASPVPAIVGPIGGSFDGRIVLLRMAPVPPGVASVLLYRAVAKAKLARFARVPASAPFFRDARVSDGVLYRYAAAALDASGRSGPISQPVSVLAVAGIPAAAAPRLHELGDRRTVELDWAHRTGTAGFVVIRRNPDGSIQTIASDVRAFAYRDVLPAGVRGRFGYALRIVTARGDGPMGPFVSIQTR